MALLLCRGQELLEFKAGSVDSNEEEKLLRTSIETSQTAAAA